MLAFPSSIYCCCFTTNTTTSHGGLLYSISIPKPHKEVPLYLVATVWCPPPPGCAPPGLIVMVPSVVMSAALPGSGSGMHHLLCVRGS